MTSGYMLKIYYRDGHTEEHYCDYYKKENGLLTYYIRFGENSGEYCIPYDLIKEFKIINEGGGMMERLTARNDFGKPYYPYCDNVKGCGGYCAQCNFETKTMDKLAEYEDFEEIFRAKMTDTACEFLKDKEEFGKWLDRRKWIAKKCDEYARAEEQGLLLRLPCKVGDTVYLIKSDGKIVPRTADMQFLGVLWEYYGKEWFLTKTEAEQKLKEMENR